MKKPHPFREKQTEFLLHRLLFLVLEAVTILLGLLLRLSSCYFDFGLELCPWNSVLTGNSCHRLHQADNQHNDLTLVWSCKSLEGSYQIALGLGLVSTTIELNRYNVVTIFEKFGALQCLSLIVIITRNSLGVFWFFIISSL